MTLPLLMLPPLIKSQIFLLFHCQLNSFYWHILDHTCDSLTKEQNLISSWIHIHFGLARRGGVEFFSIERSNYNIRYEVQISFSVSVPVQNIRYRTCCFLKGNVLCSNCLSSLCLFSLASLLCIRIDSRVLFYISIKIYN